MIVFHLHVVEESSFKSKKVKELNSDSKMCGDAVLEEKKSLHLKAMSCKSEFAKRLGSQVDIVSYRASLIAKCHVGKGSMDCDGVFSSVGKHSSIHIVLERLAQYSLDLAELNKRIALLQSDHVEIATSHPVGFTATDLVGKEYTSNIDPFV